MSRNSRNKCVPQAERTLWLRYALSLPLTAAVAVGSIGCNSVSNSQLLNTKLHNTKLTAPSHSTSGHSTSSHSALNQQQRAAPIVAAPVVAAPTQAASTQAAQRVQDISAKPVTNSRAMPADGVVTVSYEEQTQASPAPATANIHPSANAATAASLASSALRPPLATLASCQVSGSCAPSTSSGCGCGDSGCNTCTTPPAPGMNVQEYIFDGGDIDPQLGVRRDGSVAGLNPTDTVAIYETYDGKLCITPTNRVPIYAPRFGAVRKVTGAIISDHAVGTQRILAPITPGRFDDKNLATTVVQPVAPQGEERVSLIDALQDKNLGIPVAQVLPLQRMSDAIVPFENLELVGTGKIQDQEIAVLGQFMLNARTWVTPESLQVLIDNQQTSEQLDVKQAQDIHVYKLPGGKCTLRICKAASHMVANSGDTISFTLRFDNAGSQPIGKVVILDSLSPRLEYIEESQQCSLNPAPKFSAEPNDAGSTVLRWEFEQALEPGDGGVIHFRCLVR